MLLREEVEKGWIDKEKGRNALAKRIPMFKIRLKGSLIVYSMCSKLT
jgi:hypothetical protein